MYANAQSEVVTGTSLPPPPQTKVENHLLPRTRASSFPRGSCLSSPDRASMMAWSRLQTARDISSFSTAMRLQIRSIRTAWRIAVA